MHVGKVEVKCKREKQTGRIRIKKKGSHGNKFVSCAAARDVFVLRGNFKRRGREEWDTSMYRTST